MRKLIIAAATAVSALAIATPASAQYHPQPQGYSYGYNTHGQVRHYQARVNHLFRAVDQMGRRGARGGHYYQLRREVGELNYQVKRWGHNGLTRREARELDMRIARVEQMVQGRWSGNRGYNAYQGYDSDNGRDAYTNGYAGYDDGYDGRESYGYDRDRDGRDDRYENDRGWDRD